MIGQPEPARPSERRQDQRRCRGGKGQREPGVRGSHYRQRSGDGDARDHGAAPDRSADLAPVDADVPAHEGQRHPGLERDHHEEAQRHRPQAEDAGARDDGSRHRADDQRAQERVPDRAHRHEHGINQLEAERKQGRKRDDLNERCDLLPLPPEQDVDGRMGQRGQHDQRRPLQCRNQAERLQVGLLHASPGPLFGGESRQDHRHRPAQRQLVRQLADHQAPAEHGRGVE